MAAIKLVEVVKRFSGKEDEDLDLWFDRFKVAMDITTSLDTDAKKEDEMARMMPLFLEGPAYKTWQQIPEKDRKDLSAVKKELKRVFGRSKLSSWQQLKSLRLLPGERLDETVSEIKSCLRVISSDKNFPEELVSLFLLDALPKSIADNIRIQYGEKLNIDEVLSCAKALMLDINDRGAAAGITNRQPMRGAGNELSDVERSRPGVRCFGCHRIGHLHRDCLIRCYRCGQRGHLMRECQAREQGNERAGTVRLDHAGNERAGTVRPDHAAPAVQLSSGECS